MSEEIRQLFAHLQKEDGGYQSDIIENVKKLKAERDSLRSTIHDLKMEIANNIENDKTLKAERDSLRSIIHDLKMEMATKIDDKSFSPQRQMIQPASDATI